MLSSTNAKSNDHMTTQFRVFAEGRVHQTITIMTCIMVHSYVVFWSIIQHDSLKINFILDFNNSVITIIIIFYIDWSE